MDKSMVSHSMVNQTEVNLLEANQSSTFIYGAPRSPRNASLKMGADPGLKANKRAESVTSMAAQVCRICLGDDNDQENELICPCNCAGSMKDIHISCLREWLNLKKLVY